MENASFPFWIGDILNDEALTTECRQTPALSELLSPSVGFCKRQSQGFIVGIDEDLPIGPTERSQGLQALHPKSALPGPRRLRRCLPRLCLFFLIGLRFYGTVRASELEGVETGRIPTVTNDVLSVKSVVQRIAIGPELLKSGDGSPS